MRAWRISGYTDLSGDGGLRSVGRWNHKGDRIVYCSDHPSTAMLEILVHLDPEDLPESYQLIEIDIPDDLPIRQRIPENWRDDPQVCREFWRAAVAAGDTALLRVPSAIMPHAFNLLINPAHPDAVRVSIQAATRHLLDPRFLRGQRNESA